LRVRNGKGDKERVLPSSERLLKELEDYWQAQRQGKAGKESPWLFLGEKTGQPMIRFTGQNIYYRAVKKSGVRRDQGCPDSKDFYKELARQRRKEGVKPA